MATTSFGVNDALAVKLWSKKVAVEALKSTWASKFMGESDQSVVQIFDDTQKTKGDRIRIPLRIQLTGDGVQGDATMEGNEEALVYYSDDLLVDQLRHGVREGGRMSRQRVPFEVREHGRMALQDWWADRIDSWFMNQLAGRTDLGTKFTGNQSVPASDAAHTIIANAQTGEGSLSDTAAAKFTLTLIDVCVEKARTLTPPIRPIKLKGEEYYVMFLHHFQVTDMRTNTNTAQWADLQKAAIQGGQITNNPIFTGALGMYNGVVLHASSRVPTGYSVSAMTNTRRAIFCGAQAAAMGFGRENGPNRFTWVEEFFDYENQLGIVAGSVAGLKKLQFNSADFATIRVSTWASSHSTN